MRRIICAHDCGFIVNPRSLQGTIEANLIQSISRSIYEEVTFDNHTVTSVDWRTYPIAHMHDVPDEVKVVMIDQAALAPAGAGEPSSRPHRSPPSPTRSSMPPESAYEPHPSLRRTSSPHCTNKGRDNRMSTTAPRPAAAAAGTAYGMPAPSYDRDITEVGQGTPCGEWMRRYWHPVALSANVTTRPQKVRILGEDLIIFRDGKGRPGLLYPRCAHRGTTLYYGKCEDDGIRCCYHGWLFSVDGRVLDQPCEPGNASHNQELIRQPWYHVEERYGMVWTLHGAAREEAGAPALRYARRPRCERRAVLHRIELRRRRRRHDRSRAVQLAAGLGEHHGPVPRADFCTRRSAVRSSLRKWA